MRRGGSIINGSKFKKSIIVIICGMLGVSSSFILGNLIFSNYSSVSFLVYLIFLQLIITVVFFMILRIQLKKTNSESLVSLCIAAFVIFLLLGPAIVNKIDYINSIPSSKEQNQALKDASNIISHTNLPYKVDEKESKEKTKEYGMRVNIVLVKTENGYFNKREIDEFLKELPSREARITFYTFGKANLLALAMDKEKKIFSCAPFEVCRELNIDY